MSIHSRFFTHKCIRANTKTSEDLDLSLKFYNFYSYVFRSTGAEGLNLDFYIDILIINVEET